ncbi:epithelial cell adhesion molecule [Rhinatrema bivittatum]|uniref:epithelial cell adhesion molecule n=1 Tax=Rhinatrema bivittatum TaxID=194408 RepID=UPI00112BACD8|nr:epithelial cell adhesion molecule [Rhinatrema bivittatum]
MKLPLAAPLFLALLAAASAQTPTECTCATHFQGKCVSDGTPSGCACTLPIGPDNKNVDCTKLIPKCLLMKKEMLGTKGGRRQRPENALVDNDGIYHADCEDNGVFKARQCNLTETCWCVNTAGVRRTDKGDKNLKCEELVRTFWIQIELKYNGTAKLTQPALTEALTKKISQRYGLKENYVAEVEYQEPYIFIDLMQNSSQKTAGDVDIADVAYYMEKDIKGESLLPPENKFEVPVAGTPLGIENVKIYYIDEKPPNMSMKGLTPGLIAVIVVVVLAIVAGIVVLVCTRRRRTGKYQKAEVKEMGEMQSQLAS